MSKVLFLLMIYNVTPSAVGDRLADKAIVYRGASDASAAVAVGDDMFVVADDENNVLRIYKATTDTQRALAESLPLSSCDLTDFLDIEPEHPEADIEGATMVADRIYWITSHGRNKDGKMRPNRYRFFATTIKVEDGNVTIRPLHRPYRTFAHKLIRTRTMRHLGLDRATRFDAINLKKKDRKRLAPKEAGLNLEALCASADGKTLYIGFRNPRPCEKGLVVPLKNAEAVIERSAEPIFGEPMLWDLAGLGIRGMEYSPRHEAYFMVAGPHDEAQKFALYRWSGRKSAPPTLVRQLAWQDSKFSPEALIPFRNSPRLLLLSDDGALPIRVRDKSECVEGELNDDGTCPNKFLIDPKKKTFRAIWVRP